MTLNNKTTLNNEPVSFDNKEREKIEAFSDKLFDDSYTIIGNLNCKAYVTEEPLPFSKKLCGNLKKIGIGDKWAQNTFDCAWFHVTGKIPEDISENELVFLLNCGGEGLIYDNCGNEIQSITCYSAGFGAGLGIPVKRVVPFDSRLIIDGKADFWIDCGANDLFGEMDDESRIKELCVAKRNAKIRELAFDVQTLVSAYDYGSDTRFNAEIKKCLDELMQLPAVTEDNAGEALIKTKKLLKKKNSDNNTFTYSALGHAHLDLAWLWPIRESKRKGARTFSTQLKNIELYPDYIFGASQAQLYQWMKDGYPAIYNRIKDAAKTKNWDLQGATWVEMDSNLINGESLVRQFFYGKKFFRDEFGEDMKIFWVPDSFGYSACIPQVMKLADVPYFLTQKISWSIYNKFPYHSFYWQGLDGSKVLAHMLPEDTYNSPVRADLMVFGESNYREREISNNAMMLYGIGDGGAGPGYEHIERALRYKDLSGVPKVKFEKSLDFFSKLDDSSVPYPSHSGELYLERHQGTYTTQSKNKRFNRKCEFALRNYEMLMPAAKEAGVALPISHSALEELWKEVLLYQFHDILPGSSINRVYDECVKRYEIIYNTLSNSIDCIVNKLSNSKTVYNFNSFEYSKPIEFDGKWYKADVPALGCVSLGAEDEIKAFNAKCGYNFIENDKVRIEFENGCIASMYDKTLSKEIVMRGKKAAVISQYDDLGDCWDIKDCCASYIQTKKDAKCIDFSTGKNGAKAYAKAKYVIGDTVITQEFSVIDGEAQLYGRLDIDCHQKASMLRIAFPVSVKTEECSYNIQFGHISRKTTENNSIETAQFETSGQKFVDMSEDDYGVSLINDCKYGYRCKHGVMDINLIRSPKDGPGHNVDQGMQTVYYALFPHKGRLGSETYKAAYLLNNPLITAGSEIKEHHSFALFETNNENIILETIKEAEDGNGVIVRFYNSSSQSQSADIKLNGYQSAEIVNIMEDKISDKTDTLISLHSFELINIRYIKNK